jgi:hypothetical protein
MSRGATGKKSARAGTIIPRNDVPFHPGAAGHGSAAPLFYGQAMQEKDLARILESLKWMAEAEEAVGEYYRACAGVPGEDREFWLQAAGEEDVHNRSLQKMAELVSQNPERFSLNRPFNPAAIRTFISFIRQNTANLKQGKTSGESLLFVARDIERSLLELAYFEIIKTNDPDSERTIKEMKAQTVEHKQRLEQKIAPTPSPR